MKSSSNPLAGLLPFGVSSHVGPCETVTTVGGGTPVRRHSDCTMAVK